MTEGRLLITLGNLHVDNQFFVGHFRPPPPQPPQKSYMIYGYSFGILLSIFEQLSTLVSFFDK
jgi:hypothetical protein